MFPIPEKWKQFINVEQWGKEFDVKDENNYVKEIINGHILHSMEFYVERKLMDKPLWKYFREDFEGWTVDMFNGAS